jgi:DNA polymerase-3 subunit gamma/tau
MLFFYFSNYRKHKIIPGLYYQVLPDFDFKRMEDAKDHLAEVANSQGVVFEDDFVYYCVKADAMCFIYI